MRLLRRTRQRLGLSTGDVLVLDALLSFLPCRDRVTGEDRPLSGDTLLTIFASNAALCERANGMDDRVLRRHLARLADQGLLRRRDSATRKRFPIRSRGKIVDAFGIDLSPLVAALPDLSRLAVEMEAEDEERRAIRSRALALRAELLRAPDALMDEDLEFILTAKTVLRRTSLPLLEARSILDRLTALDDARVPTDARLDKDLSPMAEAPAETADRSGANGPVVRHVEPRTLDTLDCNNPNESTARDMTEAWDDCVEIKSLYPDAPRQPKEIDKALYDIGTFLGLDSRRITQFISRMGRPNALRAMDYVIRHIDRIAKPAAYLTKMGPTFPDAWLVPRYKTRTATETAG